MTRIVSSQHMPPSKSPARRKLLLLDGYSLAFRAFYALPEELTTTDGTHTNAVYGFTSMLIKLLQEERPDYLVCCLDAGAPLERTEQFADYKSNRSQAPDTFSSQVPLIREVLGALQIPIFELPGHEADDIISFLATRAAGEDLDVRVVTGDRDFFQLVGDRIHVLYNRRGITDIVDMDAKAVTQRYGVPPAKYVDLKALEGDNSDNLPGVPGVGTKTAAKLVQKYGSAEEAVAHADEQTPKLAQNLAAHAEQVALNKKLSTLAEVPLESVGLEDLKMGPWDLERVTELFKSLEFRTLLERLMADLPAAAEGEGEPFELAMEVVADAGSLTSLAARLRVTGEIALDIVPSSARGVPHSLAIAWEERAAFVAVGPRGVTPVELCDALGSLFESDSTAKIVHGGRAALISLAAAGIELEGLRLDTQVAAYLLDPAAPNYALEDVARKYTGRELKAVDPVERAAGDAQGALDLGGDMDEGAAEDACLRALAVAEVAAATEPELKRLGMLDLYYDIEHPLIGVLAGMERAGVRLDLDYLATMAADLDERIENLEVECYEHAGQKLNLGSPQQLRILLYDKLGLKTTRRTKTGLSTDARALQQLVDQHPFVKALLDYRELAKLKNTYVDALPPLVDKVDGRLHTTFDQTVAATGRLSSTNPNLQNIPIRTDIGRTIRRAFVAEPGNLLLSADYSQIELRVMAHLSKDPLLVEVFAKEEEDVHAATAARVFGVDPGELTVRQRSIAKMVNYGLAYGMGAPGLAERLNVPVPEAKVIMEAYFEQMDGVRKFLDNVVTQAYADGFTTTMFGRRRYLPELGSGNPRVRAIGERQALNAPIQGSAADIMKLAMIHVDGALRDEGLTSRMILTVHDELVFEVPPDEQEAAGALVRRAMAGVCAMEVPLGVEVAFAATWAAAKS